MVCGHAPRQKKLCTCGEHSQSVALMRRYSGLMLQKAIFSLALTPQRITQERGVYLPSSVTSGPCRCPYGRLPHVHVNKRSDCAICLCDMSSAPNDRFEAFPNLHVSVRATWKCRYLPNVWPNGRRGCPRTWTALCEGNVLEQ